MKVVDTIEKLKTVNPIIEDLYNNHGLIFQQSFDSLQINLNHKSKGEFCIFYDDEKAMISAFEKKEKDLWECSIQGYPILFKGNINKKNLIKFLDYIKTYLRATSLYFPLIYENYSLANDFKSLDNSITLNRLPSPIIFGGFDQEDLWDQVTRVYGENRSKRQKRKFEKELKISVINNSNHEDIEDIITKVELNSWKHKSQQDMISRHQFIYYTNLIKSGVAQLIVAFKNETPVAFRIDSLVNKIVYIIKWSYNENYKNFSPGFYLLTVDMPLRYKDTNLKYIDLFGSPDALKDTIQNSQIVRFDIYYPKSPEAEIYKLNRYEFDKKVHNNYINKKSIKNLYIKI